MLEIAVEPGLQVDSVGLTEGLVSAILQVHTERVPCADQGKVMDKKPEREKGVGEVGVRSGVSCGEAAKSD